jgi:hypothetical protein
LEHPAADITRFSQVSRAVEPPILEASVIKARDTARPFAEIEKTRRKTGSGRHVQKNGVLYKGKGSRQIMERTEEEQAALDVVVNTRVQTKVKKTEKKYRKWIKLLPKNIDTWRDSDSIKDYYNCVG